MEQQRTSRKSRIIDHEKRNTELEKLKLILSKLSERKLKWVDKKIYGMNKSLYSIPNTLKDRKFYEQRVFRHFETNVQNAVILAWKEVYKACMEYFIPTENFRWLASDIQLQLYLLNRLTNLGIKLRVLQTDELMPTIIEIIETHYISSIDDSLELKETPKLQLYPFETIDYQANWLKFLESIRLQWTNFLKDYKKFRWIHRKNTYLLNWIYTYRRKDGINLLLDFYHPLDNDYNGKYAHILLSLNLLNPSPTIIRMYKKGKKLGQTYETSERQLYVEALQKTWEKHKQAKRKKENKQPINFNEKTKKQLNEIAEKENTTIKKAMVKVIDKYYNDMKKNLSECQPQKFKKRKITRKLPNKTFNCYIYGCSWQGKKLKDYFYVPYQVPQVI